MEARFKAADEEIQKVPNLGQAFGSTAEALDGLNDSHTFLSPPNRSTRNELGYVLQMVGDRCLITAVRPGTDVVQLEHRGTVLGDHSSGSVMESQHYPFSQGANTKVFYGASITDADLLMGDGKSLEHTGVTPDEVILPTPADLAAGRDPVLARAVELAGGMMDAVEAGKLFPVEWQPN